ncbi:hypothetical protein ACFQ60_01630 [Streptomyces zhihengii]
MSEFLGAVDTAWMCTQPIQAADPPGALPWPPRPTTSRGHPPPPRAHATAVCAAAAAPRCWSRPRLPPARRLWEAPTHICSQVHRPPRAGERTRQQAPASTGATAGQGGERSESPTAHEDENDDEEGAPVTPPAPQPPAQPPAATQQQPQTTTGAS